MTLWKIAARPPRKTSSFPKNSRMMAISHPFALPGSRRGLFW
jgi:hypothetical protein